MTSSEVISRIPSSKFVRAKVMLSRLVKFRKGDSPYEDLDGDDKVEMDITDLYSSGSRPVSSSYGDSSGATNRARLSLGGEMSDLASLGSKDTEETFTVEQAIDQIGFGPFQIKLSVLTGFAWMADAMEMMILAILSPALHCSWQLTGLQEAAITTVVFCGMMSSSGLWGSICDKYGRKTELIMCSVVTFYFGILSAFSPSYVWLLILRGLVGFGIGGAPQAVTLYAEFLPSKTRAACVTLVEIFWAIGACFEVLLALLIMPTLGWQWLLGLSSLPLLIFACCCAWLPESARYDLTRGCYDKAVKTLERIARENGKSMPLGKLVEPEVQHVKRGRVMDLLKPEMRFTTVLLWIIWLVCAFSYYGIVLLTTALFESPDGCHGTDVKFNPDPACFLECKTLTKDDYKDLTWTTLAEFPGLFLTAFLLEKIGRKYTMAIEFGIFSLFVFLVNICTTRALLTVFLFVSRAFISGAFQGAYIYTPEFYPTSMRAMGLGTCSGMARIGAIVTPFVAQVLLKVSAYVAISLYGVMCLIATVASLLLPYETKGREMKDITQQVTEKKARK
ncbi:synaptic vesicle 2-related protein-like isoform X3 [Pomacea canaliculata]|uniref:synaptic vesicle 2-related protein-like isoform X3 n=1 Tax=Pomacea canaliculata TaxID=400727 RepID=UPI000D73BDF9|nr:synaptic vesicle 2-related protein-like isoform X3 [Pomacea canaliculata]